MQTLVVSLAGSFLTASPKDGNSSAFSKGQYGMDLGGTSCSLRDTRSKESNGPGFKVFSLPDG